MNFLLISLHYVQYLTPINMQFNCAILTLAIISLSFKRTIGKVKRYSTPVRMIEPDPRFTSKQLYRSTDVPFQYDPSSLII